MYRRAFQGNAPLRPAKGTVNSCQIFSILGIVIGLIIFVIVYLQASSTKISHEPVITTFSNKAMAEWKEDQERFCKRYHERPDAFDLDNHVKIKTGLGFEMYVYKHSDIVSKFLVETGYWEYFKLTTFVNEIHQLAPSNLDNTLPFVDIGAHVGWFSLAVASHNISVVAFEPLRDNLLLFRKNLCINPDLAERITLIPMGLSDKRQECTISSSDGNVGDGIVLCNGLKDETTRHRGAVQLATWKDFFPENVTIIFLKVDLEGYEYKAIAQGAAHLFAQKRVMRCLTEYFPKRLETISIVDPRDYIAFFEDNGYRLQVNGPQGHFISSITGINAAVQLTDLYLSPD